MQRKKPLKIEERELDPLVQHLFLIMETHQITPYMLERETAGELREQTILKWKNGVVPGVTPLRICFEVLGYKLQALACDGEAGRGGQLCVAQDLFFPVLHRRPTAPATYTGMLSLTDTGVS